MPVRMIVWAEMVVRMMLRLTRIMVSIVIRMVVRWND